MKRYKMEEWMGALAEAGYSVKEGNAATKQMKNAAMANRTGQIFRGDAERYASTSGGAKGGDGGADYRHALQTARGKAYNPVGFKASADSQGKSFGSASDPLAVKAKNVAMAAQQKPAATPTPNSLPLPGKPQTSAQRADIQAKMAASLAASKAAGAKPPVPPTRPALPPLPGQRKQAVAERYSMEEWMGALEESGYSIKEDAAAEKKAADATLRGALAAKGQDASIKKVIDALRAQRAAQRAAKLAAKKMEEELKHGKSSYDATAGISTTALTKDGKPVGYVKHTRTDKGLVAGGRIGPKAAKVAK